MTDTHVNGEMIPAKEAARVLGVNAQTLCVWRRKKQGPPYIRRVRLIFYTKSDIANWLDRNRVES